jgi:hypothetical protein
MEAMKYGDNIGKPPLKVHHSDLERFSDSPYKSKCPVCKKGALLIRRHPKTFELIELDICIACGQSFIYLDIRTLRRMDSGDPERN